MIISDIDLRDQLINGQFRTVVNFGYVSSLITKMYLKLDDEYPGKNFMFKYTYASKHKVVPIRKVKAKY